MAVCIARGTLGRNRRLRGCRARTFVRIGKLAAHEIDCDEMGAWLARSAEETISKGKVELGAGIGNRGAAFDARLADRGRFAGPVVAGLQIKERTQRNFWNRHDRCTCLKAKLGIVQLDRKSVV